MSLRSKLLLPLLVVGLLLAAQATLYIRHGASAPGLPWGDPVLLAWAMAMGVLLLAAGVIEYAVCRPLGGLAYALHELRGARRDASPTPAGRDGMDDLAADLALLGERVQRQDDELQRAAQARLTLERQLHECEERHVLTVERANDGIWEWDIKTGMVRFSPRWCGMLGCTVGAMERIDDWKDLIHADDRQGTQLRLDNHVLGVTPHFDAEYRLRHRDGHYRWVQSRGTALRHASGAAYRLLVMDIDIHPRKELEQTLIVAAEGLSSISGMEFFRALMRNLSEILGTRDNLVCYCPDDPPKHARTLAYYSRGEFWENFDYELEGTSCGAVIAGREIVYVPTGVCDIWPLEKQYDRDSYIGVPMFDSKGKIIGHFACMDGKAMQQDLPHLAIFKIFSVRAAAELERTLLRQQLGLSQT